MIFNRHIDQLTQVDFVQNFMTKHSMRGLRCAQEENFSFIIYRSPYIIEFYDALIENYLEIYFSSLDENLLIDGNSALGCSLDMGLQKLADVRARDFTGNFVESIFLSEGYLKARNLYSNLEALDKLFPIIESKGLMGMIHGTFDARFDFRNSVKSINTSLKKKYLQCIGNSGT